MFQLRDSWDNTLPDDQAATAAAGDAAKDTGAGIVSFFKSVFDSVPTPETPTHEATHVTSPTPTTKTTVTTPIIVRPWYKTPIGIIAILATAFAGYKYVLPRLRKK